MNISEFDYDLPEELIAQSPLPQRDASRMLVVDRATKSWTDSTFLAFSEHLRPDDVVVFNNSRVIPARLVGRRLETGGKVEVFLVRELEDGNWESLVRPGSRLRSGDRVGFGENKLFAEIMDEPGQELRKVRFYGDGPFEELLSEVGSTPLPPYIKRPDGVSEQDRERYQTIYAKNRGAIAAPTAGLHFSETAFEKTKERAHIAEVTLHVGYGTFEPVRVEDIGQHSVSAEVCEVTTEAADAINNAHSKGGKIFAVGTTTVRCLESSASSMDQIESGKRNASLTITPGYRFKITSALLTNFHLPKSSLLLLVCAFAGRELVLDAYRHAVNSGYRFYSYGDCMLIL
jgi:S-adenosylmethionine:tRNA ribosyltransferase-isomerase